MFQVRILGTSAAIPTNTRMPSAQVVTINDRHHLVDCGEATQIQLLKHKVKFSRLDAIFISHLHGDHVLGVPGLLTSLSLYERNFPLKMFAPSGLKKILDVVFAQTHSYLNYELDFVPLEDFEPGSILYQTPKYKVEVLPLDHRIFCRGFRFVETNKKPKFDFYKAKALEVPNNYFTLLKQGNVITLEDGRVVTPEDVLMTPDAPLSFAYCSDTKYNEALIDHIKDTRLLYHESTFLNNLRDRAEATCHSTALDAGRIAQQANVNQLLLGHFSARYRDLQPLLDEARTVFPNTLLAREGNLFNVKDYV
ncbi:ribonuclease Z [Pontibacter sp. G13]|uniref:ribonuclease Z n=1 Tax=Pontibacter sp. G13 TaxID=3074898 RepID=UPI0028890121|nr:ribonuclease Z [Pontibacter sp. G13]WNJ21180.1 ribonuclease Z [Pontibacter sp. G13]